jgi:tRNA (guanine6-N2)-methyltransferase
MHRFSGRASAPTRVPVMVRTLRGLEAIARTEVVSLLGERLPVAVEHRTLRCTADLGGAASLIAAIRPLARPIRFDVTASFIGRRNFSRFEVQERVGAAIARATGWGFVARGTRAAPPVLSLRVHLLHERATLAVRLAGRPLHRRAYRIRSRPGALHTPLARALCLLAQPRPGDLLVDPTCGVGTIPIEAALLEPRADVAAFDLEPDAVGAARRNAAEAGVDLPFAIADASRLPLPAGSVDRIVVNPPWGEAVAARGGLRCPASLWREAARVLAPRGRLVALIPPTMDAARSLRAAGLDPEPLACVRVSGAEAVVTVAARNGVATR